MPTDTSAPAEVVLKARPFCGGPVQHRFALWPSDGDVDSIIHSKPTTCGMVDFTVDSIDGGKTVAEVWNTRAQLLAADALDAGTVEACAALVENYDWARSRHTVIVPGIGPARIALKSAAAAIRALSSGKTVGADSNLQKAQIAPGVGTLGVSREGWDG